MAEMYLDLGLDCGWTVYWRDGHITHGVEKFRNVGSDRVRYRAFRLWLIAKQKEVEVAKEKLELIGFEYIDFIPKRERQQFGPHTYGAFRGLLLAWCETNSIPDHPINWDVVKKHVTGIRSAAKDLVTKRIKKLFPTVEDHNEADAVAVWMTAHNKHPHRMADR